MLIPERTDQLNKGATLYCPNLAQLPFLARTLSAFTEGILILGGNFNLPLHASLDTSSGSTSVSLSAQRKIAKLLHDYQLVDIWRIQHLTERIYTFFSSSHQTYSRIDLFLLHHAQLHWAEDSKIHTITWSDHAPISVTVSLPTHADRPRWNWRLNDTLLQDPVVMAKLKRELGYTSQ